MLSILLTAALAQPLSGMPFVRGPMGPKLPTFEAFGPSGRGQPAVSPLCTAAAGLNAFTGSWWCLDSNGNAPSAPITLAAQGTVSANTQRVCPNNSNCGTLTERLGATTTAGLAEAANVVRNGSAPSGWTACWEGIHTTAAAEEELLSLSSSVGVWQYVVSVPVNVDFLTVYVGTAACGNSTSFTSSGGVLIPGAHQLLCVNYNEGGDNKYRIYIDGVLDQTSTAQATTCAGGTTSRHSLGGLWNTNALLASITQKASIGGLYTEKVLTGSQLSSLATSVLARTVTGAKGEAVTYARTGPMWCPAGDVAGSGNVVPANVLCRSALGALANASGTNVALRWQEFDNAVWSATSSGGASAATKDATNTALGPDGTLTAEQLTFAATTTAQTSYVGQAALTAAAYSCVVRLKAVSGTGSVDVGITKASGTTAVPCAINTTSWSWCEVDNVTSAAGGSFVIGNLSTATGVARSQVSAYVTDAHCEQATSVGPPVPTVSATNARGNATGSFAGVTAPGTTGSFSATVTPWGTGANALVAGLTPGYFAATAQALYFDTTPNAKATDGTNTPTISAALAGGTSKTYSSSWDIVNGWMVRNTTDTNGNTTAFTSTFWTPSTTLSFIGGGGTYGNGWLKNLCMSSGSDTRCDPANTNFFELASPGGIGLTAGCAASITGTRGQTVTFTRASPAMMYADDGQTVQQCASNTVRVSSGTATSGQLGVWIEPPVTPRVSAAAARDLTAAGWTASGVSCVPTRGMRSDVSDTTGASRCTATVDSATISYAITAAAAMGTTTMNLKRVSGTGSIYVTRDAFANSFDVGPRLSTTEWKRVVPYESSGCAGGHCITQIEMSTNIANPTPGIKFARAGDVIDVDFVQDQLDDSVTAPNITGAATAADVLQVDFGTGSDVPTAESLSVGVTLYGNALTGNAGAGLLVYLSAISQASTSGVDAVWLYNYLVPGYEACLVGNSTAIEVREQTGSAGATSSRHWCTSSLGTVYGRTGVQRTQLSAGLTGTHNRLRYFTLGSINGSYASAGVYKSVCISGLPGRCLDSDPSLPGLTKDVIWLGDSIVAGAFSGSTTPPVALTSLQYFDTGDYRNVFNAGYPGDRSYTCAARWTQQLRQLPAKTLIWSCSVNDFINNDTAVTASTNAEATIADAVSQGKRVIVTGTMPFGSVAGYQASWGTEKDSYNAIMAAYCAIPANGCEFVSTDSMGTGSPLALTTGANGNDSGDGLHPSVRGGRVLAGLTYTKLGNAR